MKSVSKILLLLIVFNVSKAQAENTIGLKSALKQRIISIKAQYNDNSVHYIGPVECKLINLSKTVLKIKIEAGDLFEPEDTGCQTMMVVGEMLVSIKPGETVTAIPYGMCIEPRDRAGRTGLKYTFRENSNTKLMDIAKYLSTKKCNNFIGQEAVWCVADPKRDLLEINGYDSISRENLIAEVARITGKPLPDRKSLRQAYINYTAPLITETLGGSFEYKLSKTKKIHIAMFNAQGTVVRELYANAAEKAGVHKIKFEFDYTVYTDASYTIKLIADEEVMLTSIVDRDDEGWIEE